MVKTIEDVQGTSEQVMALQNRLASARQKIAQKKASNERHISYKLTNLWTSLAVLYIQRYLFVVTISRYHCDITFGMMRKN